MISNFQFIAGEWPAIYEAASKAEAAVHPDPRTACFYACRALELAVAWAYEHDSSLRLSALNPYAARVFFPRSAGLELR